MISTILMSEAKERNAVVPLAERLLAIDPR